jgi:hypothetical protein
MAREHDETTLPRWAQDRLASLRSTIEQQRQDLGALSVAHAVLSEGHRWFIIPGPDFHEGEERRGLFVLSRNQAVAVCTLGKGDRLLVGRASR